MTSLGVKTITGLYIGLSAVAFYFFMHAAVTGQQLLTPASSTNTPTTVSMQPAPNTGSSTTSTPPDSSSTPGSGNLASQQYDQTTNWAGYAATGNTYTSIDASWQAPTASNTGETSADATWIGIGGITSNDLIQVGTQNLVSPDGTVSTSAFYEMLPDASINIPTVNINPGDSVSASIDEVGSGEWRITLSDSTTGESFSTIVDYSSSESSAEWIEEDPSDGTDQQIPLDSFGTVTFSGATTTEDGTEVSITKSGAQEVTMVNGADQSLADVSSLSSNGETFSVTRTSAATGSSIAAFNSNPGGWVRQGSGMGFGAYGYGRSYHYSMGYGF